MLLIVTLSVVGCYSLCTDVHVVSGQGERTGTEECLVAEQNDQKPSPLQIWVLGDSFLPLFPANSTPPPLPSQSHSSLNRLLQWLSGEDICLRSGRHKSWPIHTSDLKIGFLVTSQPDAWCNGVSAGTGWPSVSILWLGGMASLICNFYLSVAEH